MTLNVFNNNLYNECGKGFLKEVHAASFPTVLRRYAQSISGRSSSHRTAPPVAFSMSGHLPVGIGLFPRTHWFTVGTETPKILAKAACPPVFSQAFVMGSFVFMPHY